VSEASDLKKKMATTLSMEFNFVRRRSLPGKASKRDKWYLLRLGARWDHAIVPIYEATAYRGRVPLLKTLLTSSCKNDCVYCAFRANRKCPRISWKPEKLAKITLHLWKEGKIKGLFLSSSVSRDPDQITEKQLEVLRLLRGMGYSGYVHLRLMPGVSRHLVKEGVQLADRVGVNLEAPNEEIFEELCPDKGGFKEAVLKRLEWVVQEAGKTTVEEVRPKFGFANAGVDTQMIVGALEDNDIQHLKTTEWLYKKLNLKRVYYSGFEPIPHTPLEKQKECPPSREYRLYQASFLIRDYGFKAEELAQIADEKGFLPNLDPKIAFAKMKSDLFPLDLNTASFYEIVRIPHVGPVTARRIIKARKVFPIKHVHDLEKIMGRVLARKILPYVDLRDKKLTDFQK